MFHCIDDVVLTSADSLADLNSAAISTWQALDSWGWMVNDCKVQGPGLPEAVIDKTQAYR